MLNSASKLIFLPFSLLHPGISTAVTNDKLKFFAKFFTLDWLPPKSSCSNFAVIIFEFLTRAFPSASQKTKVSEKTAIVRRLSIEMCSRHNGLLIMRIKKRISSGFNVAIKRNFARWGLCAHYKQVSKREYTFCASISWKQTWQTASMHLSY